MDWVYFITTMLGTHTGRSTQIRHCDRTLKITTDNKQHDHSNRTKPWNITKASLYFFCLLSALGAATLRNFKTSLELVFLSTFFLQGATLATPVLRNWVAWTQWSFTMWARESVQQVLFNHLNYKCKQEVKVIWQKASHGGPIPRLWVTPGGRKLYH